MSNEVTEFHAKFFAHALTRRCSTEDSEKFAGTLVSSPQVDLNPHQVSAALFAFKSPLSNGVILADEVGLGKTIEAGILLSQRWAERKRKILIIVPATLRPQWCRELSEKFYLPSKIVEGIGFGKAIKRGVTNPFDQNVIILCSYHFAANKAEYLSQVSWDLVVMDEAHKLRNVYKDESKIAQTLLSALIGFPKILLTATPLQNSLMELYGLVSFIDPYIFGDESSFRERYMKQSLAPQIFEELKSRLAPICYRCLRRDVLEYIRYTKRISVVQEFTPTAEEQALYEAMIDFIGYQGYSFAHGVKPLMALLLAKLMASSTFAIQGTLELLARRLKAELRNDESGVEEIHDIDRHLAAEVEALELSQAVVSDEPMIADGDEATIYGIQEELATVEQLCIRAASITDNSKGVALLEGLDVGFKKIRKLQAAEKAIVFTEFRRTQHYILRILKRVYSDDQIVIFNGTNNDPKSQRIYDSWKSRPENSGRVSGNRSVDVKSALVDHFRENAAIMIATEAAAEGVNLQFCSLVINYDLPWNPQRVEQRIGRCHRYGQIHDVVVVNFLNRNNAADQRVFELLNEKFKLFSGVFGASDEVLGALESGMDLERRIADIYKTCRLPHEINSAFDELQNEYDQQIEKAMRATQRRLLENFDSDVHDRLRVNFEAGKECLGRYESWLLKVTKWVLSGSALFTPPEPVFDLFKNPYSDDSIKLGRYKLGALSGSAFVYRMNHPLAHRVLEDAMSQETPFKHLTFDWTASRRKVAMLKELVGKSGQLELTKLTIKSADTQDHLVWGARTDDGIELDAEQCIRLFSALPCQVCSASTNPLDLSDLTNSEVQKIVARAAEQNTRYFEAELGKLEGWANDKKRSLEVGIRKADTVIQKLKKAARLAVTLDEKFKITRQIQILESKLTGLRREYFAVLDEIRKQKDSMLDEAEKRLRQSSSTELLFAVQFSIV
ncbi:MULTISPECIES: SNF2-related protein [unclassified Lentimonas]|uniref:SNF2-related protein n=1 Tax=unclassified Lentimonas TaxID=2630993 RepID=UPI001322CE18|nr:MULTISPECIES: SNF2-related protein [unclassified Lentimonas]CAA6679306.1 Unannotated [Lentimonas sp. CC4]CAA6686342.1 Unannotated [Lentimonas sp. CC6]CAA7076117.1 Unannotated [Lentimonas sp. CC4]CAA7170890.1 Unannotated [Lentimonas sp. CC21]CAA7181168.1 Unannotated [Lentimonas sp. CC8]